MILQADMSEEEVRLHLGCEWWDGMSAFDIATTQLRTDILITTIKVYQHALEEVLHRPVYTHEMADREALLDELIGGREAPTNREIIQQLQAKVRSGQLMVLEVNDDEDPY